MATEVKRRRGSDSDHQGFTGAVAELTVNTDDWTVHVHDGTNNYGYPLLRQDFDNVPTTAPFTHITLDTAIFDTTYSETGNETQGTLYWNSDEETISLVTNGESFELGQKTEIHVRNNTGSQINKGEVVYASGTVGNSGRILISKMIADGTVTAKRIMGVAAENIANSTDGKIITFGKLKNINTSSFSDGDILYVSATTAGGFQNTEPSQANGHVSLPIAYVIHAHSNGQIFIRVTPIDENEYQDYDAGLTDIAGLTPTDSNFIVGDGTNWVAESGATARASLGAQAQDPQLDDIAGLTPTDGNFIVGNGTNFVAESGNTARTSLGLGTSDSPTFNGLTSTGVIITDEIDTTSITWNTSTLEWDATPSEKFNNPVFIGTSLDVDNGINADQHIHAGTYLKADTYLEVGTSAKIGTTLYVTGATTLNSTLSVTGNTTISGTLDAPTLNTGQGDNELYAMNQNVRTSDSVTFDTLGVTNNATVGGTLGVTGAATFDTSILLDAAAKFESEEGYLSGFTGSGFNLSKVSSLYRLELDDMFIRGALFASEFIINQITAINGSDILSAGRGKIEAIVDATVGAEVLKVGDPTNESGAEISNFVAGDIVIVQQVQPNQSQLVKRIVRLVNSVSGNEITLEPATSEPNSTPVPVDTGTFAVGDVIVAIGSESDTNRQANIYRTVIESDSPYVRVNDGIALYSDWAGYDKVKLQYGKLDSLTSLHSTVSGYGFYGENTFLTGALLVGDLSRAGQYMEFSGSTLTVQGNIIVQSGSSGIASFSDAGAFATLDTATLSLISDAGAIAAIDAIDSGNATTYIGAGAITTGLIAANTIVAGNIAAGTITATEISTGTITANEIAAGTITANEIDVADLFAENIEVTGKLTATDGTYEITLGELAGVDVKIGTSTSNGEFYGLYRDLHNYFGIHDGDLFTEYAFRVGDANNFLEFDGTNVTINTNTFDLATPTLVIDSTNNKVALGTSANSITIDGTEVGFIADGAGEFKAYADANNYIRLANSALDIKAESFDLETSTVVLNSAGNGKLIVGTDADNQLVNDGVGFFVTGDGNFRVGTIEQGSDSYIKFDGSTVSIVTDTFDLESGNLHIDSEGTTFPSASSSTADSTSDKSAWSSSSWTSDNFAINDKTTVKFQFDYDITSSGEIQIALFASTDGTNFTAYSQSDTTAVINMFPEFADNSKSFATTGSPPAEKAGFQFSISNKINNRIDALDGDNPSGGRYRTGTVTLYIYIADIGNASHIRFQVFETTTSLPVCNATNIITQEFQSVTELNPSGVFTRLSDAIILANGDKYLNPQLIT